MTPSNIEFASLELQRFWGISKNDRHKLRAELGECPFLWLSLLLGGIALHLREYCYCLVASSMVCEGVHCLPIRCDALLGLKPVTPLRVCVGAGLKPVTPLRGKNAGFPGVVGSQWCCRFHWSASGRRAVVLLVSLCSTSARSGHWGRQGSGHGGGFARHEALRLRVTGVSEPHVVRFPPFGGGEAAARGGVVPKMQTTSAKIGENGVLWARWSAFWAPWCLSWRAVRTQTPEHAR